MGVFAYIQKESGPKALLSADSETELVKYAYGIGLKPSQIKQEGEWNVHFELTGSNVGLVLHDPFVQLLTNTHFVRRIQGKR